MVLPLAGTMSVTNGENTFVWTGAPLTRLNCIPGATVVVDGATYFIGAEPTDTSHGVFTRLYAGATSSAAEAEISQLSPDQVRIGELNKRAADLMAELSVVEANGRGLFYRFSDAVTDSDPGAGYLRLNNLTIGSATAAYLDNLDANGADVSGVLDSWDDQGTPSARGQLWLRSIADPSAFHAFKVTDAVLDGTGYRKLALTYVGGSGGFAADDELMAMFSAQGADGTNAVLGVWQGPWVTASDYDVDDLVEHDGSTYICIEAHTAGTFAADFAADKWDLAVQKGDPGADSTVPGPQGPLGINWQGAYSGATDYVLNDGVLHNGSSWRALQATTGNAPPNLPTTSNAFWYLVSRQGNDGAGTVASVVPGTGLAVDNTDPTAPVISAPTLVAGPDDAVDGEIALYDGPSGKLLRSSGKTINDLIPAGYNDLLATVALLALQVADNSNVALFLGETGNRVADSFDTLTYVDVAGATNLDTGSPGCLKPTVVVGSDQTATHTAATTSGNTVSASGFLSGYPSWQAFDKVVGGGTGVGCWIVNGTTGWLQYLFSAAKTIGAYSLRSGTGGTYGSRMCRDWTLLGSDTGAFAGEEVVLDTRSGETGWGDGGATRTYSIGTPASYAYYRLNITANNGDPSYIHIDEMTLRLVGATNNLAVASNLPPSATVPSVMKVLFLVKEVDAGVAGVDYTMECTRDGIDWVLMTLTEKFSSVDGSRVIESEETDMSGQPSGTAPDYRFKTLTNKMIELRGAYYYQN